MVHEPAPKQAGFEFRSHIVDLFMNHSQFNLRCRTRCMRKSCKDSSSMRRLHGGIPVLNKCREINADRLTFPM
jgi:hypothetical protein